MNPASCRRKDAAVALVVPVYNVAPYLKECLDSILQQTYEDFVIFAVDDGSTDESGRMLEDYAARDSRLIVLHQKNGGLGSARNTALAAIEERSGLDYVAFVDSDDRLDRRYLEKLVSEAEKTSADIVVCGLRRFDERGYWTSNEMPCPKNALTKEDFAALVFGLGEWTQCIGRGGFVVKQLFRTVLVRGLRFPTGRVIEDEYYTLAAVTQASVIRYLPEKLYDYRQRGASLNNTPDAYEKLAAGRRLCLAAASGISKSVSDMATLAYLSALVDVHKTTGIIPEIPAEYLQVFRTKGRALMRPKTYRRFWRMHRHPVLARCWWHLLRLVRPRR